MHIQNYINGRHVDSDSGGRLDIFNPATGHVYGSAPASTSEDVEKAVSAARAAFPAWSILPAEQRGKHLVELATAIESNADKFALAESDDNGKPVFG